LPIGSFDVPKKKTSSVPSDKLPGGRAMLRALLDRYGHARAVDGHDELAPIYRLHGCAKHGPDEEPGVIGRDLVREN
jgi:hypothetical protein